MKPAATLNVADYLVLTALSRRPMTTKELSQATHQSRATIQNLMRRYAEHGLVVKGMGHKWHAATVLWVARSEEIAAGVTGEPVKVTEQAKRTVEAIDTVQNPSQNPSEKPQIAPEPPQIPSPEPTAPKKYEPPRSRHKLSKQAEHLQSRFHVPGHLEGYGEVSFGSRAGCERCKGMTPFKYGGQPLCPKCARGGI